MRSSADIQHAMDAYGDAVWRACTVYLPPSQIDDVFQDTFVKYAMSDQAFQDESHRKAWLLRVAINCCKDELKAARRKTESLDEAQNSALAGALADPSAPYSEELREILLAMDSLGDPPKTELYLSLYEGYTAPEIAKMTGEPEGTVYSWISRGKKQLKEALR